MSRVLTHDIATADLVGRTVTDPELGGRFTVAEVVEEPDGAVVLVARVAENSDHYVVGEEFDILLTPRPSQGTRYLLED